MRDDSGEPVPLQLSLRQYREAILNASDSRFVLDGHIDDIECELMFAKVAGMLFNSRQSTLPDHCTAI